MPHSQDMDAETGSVYLSFANDAPTPWRRVSKGHVPCVCTFGSIVAICALVSFASTQNRALSSSNIVESRGARESEGDITNLFLTQPTTAPPVGSWGSLGFGGGFGATTRAPLSWGGLWGGFGATATTAPTAWGGLGATATSAPTGWGGLGSTATTASPTAMESNFKQIGEQFSQFFYQTFDTNRPGLTPLYEPHSLLTFEGEEFQGAQSISQKLASLQFRTVKHNILKSDFQPVPGSPDKVLVLITGTIVVDGNEAAPVKFVEHFQLCKKPIGGSWFVLNDMFRTNN